MLGEVEVGRLRQLIREPIISGTTAPTTKPRQLRRCLKTAVPGVSLFLLRQFALFTRISRVIGAPATSLLTVRYSVDAGRLIYVALREEATQDH
jgi:hypothetical protein